MKADKLPPKLERFIGAITTSTRAADAPRCLTTVGLFLAVKLDLVSNPRTR